MLRIRLLELISLLYRPAERTSPRRPASTAALRVEASRKERELRVHHTSFQGHSVTWSEVCASTQIMLLSLM